MNDEEAQLTKELVDEWLPKIRIPNAADGKPTGRKLCLMVVELIKETLPDLIARAQKGDRQAAGALCIEASKRIAAGERLEEPLASYVIEALMRPVLKYKRTKGDKTLIRDLLAIKVLSELKKHGVNPTSGEKKPTAGEKKSPTKSGCAYLADELNSRGMKVTERALAEVWKDRHSIWGVSID
jgi:hypothetical protein